MRSQGVPVEVLTILCAITLFVLVGAAVLHATGRLQVEVEWIDVDDR